MYKKKTVIPVAFICDTNYVMQTAVAIVSLILNRGIDTIYDIIIITEELQSEDIKKLLSLGDERAKIHIEICSSEKYATTFTTHGSYIVATTIALLKFELPNICVQYDKIIYMDSDVIVKDDLKELYAFKLGDNYAGVVRDLPQVLYDVPRFSEVGMGLEYFNSGMMLLNLKLLRQENIQDKLISCKRERIDDNLMDQNVFNIIFGGNILQLPIKYNVCYANLFRSQKRYSLEKINKLYGTNFKSVSDIASHAVIIHYSSKDKPWKYFDSILADEWLFYYLKCPFVQNKLYRTTMNPNGKGIPALQEQKNHIPIVFATNQNYAPVVGVAIQSVVENRSMDYQYDIYVLYTDLCQNTLEKIERIQGENYFVRCINVNNCFSQKLYTCGHFTVEMYYRILIPEIFPQYEKVIYLDCDLVLMQDVAKLYEINLSGYTIAAARNMVNQNMYNYVQKRLMISCEDYINSGVLVIDTKKFIEKKIKKRFMSVLSLRESYACPDQDVLSICCLGDIYFLPDYWNFQWHHLWPVTENSKLLDIYKYRYREAEENAIIFHYTGDCKPWIHPDKKYADIFWDYAKICGFYEEIILNGLKVVKNEKENENKVKHLEQEIESLKQLVKSLEYNTYCLEETRKSITYKIGYFITLIPRKIIALVRKKNGRYCDEKI